MASPVAPNSNSQSNGCASREYAPGDRQQASWQSAGGRWERCARVEITGTSCIRPDGKSRDEGVRLAAGVAVVVMLVMAFGIR